MRNAETVVGIHRERLGAHETVAGEPVAGKLARRVRAGGRWKRTCTTGTSPAAYRCEAKINPFRLMTCGVNPNAVRVRVAAACGSGCRHCEVSRTG